MGTSIENGSGGGGGDAADEEQQEEEVIPWSCVDEIIRKELIIRLNPECAMSGNNWRGLAGRLEYTTAQIRAIESEKGNNTREFFNEYDRRDNSSFNEVFQALKDMERMDCVRFLEKNLPRIRRNHEREKENEARLQQEPDNMTAIPSTAPILYQVHYPPPPQTPQQSMGVGAGVGYVGWCSMPPPPQHNSFNNHHPHHHHHHSGVGASAGGGYPSSPSYCHMTPHHPLQMAPPMGSYMAAAGGVAYGNPSPTETSAPSPPGAIRQQSHTPPRLHMDIPKYPGSPGGAPSYHYPASSPPMVNHHHPHHPHPTMGFSDQPPAHGSYNIVTNNAAMGATTTSPTVASPPSCVFYNVPQDPSSSSVSSSQSPKVSPDSDKPYNFSPSGHPGMMLNSLHASNGRGDGGALDHRNGKNTRKMEQQYHHNIVVVNNYSSSRGGDPDLLLSNNYSSQISNENNSSYPSSSSMPYYNGSNNNNINGEAHQTQQHRHQHHQDPPPPYKNSPLHHQYQTGNSSSSNNGGGGGVGAVGGVGGGGGSGSYVTAGSASGALDPNHPRCVVVDSRESLQKMAEISQMPNKYQPTDEYKTFVAKQDVEDKKQRGRSSRTNGSRMSGGSGTSTASSSSSSSSSQHKQEGAVAHMNGNQQEELPQMAGLSIDQSSPVPTNVEASRRPNVYVTYSKDNERHKKDVLSLTMFLNDNNNSVWADVASTPTTPRSNMADTNTTTSTARRAVEPYQEYYGLADFILVCISPKYLQDIRTPPSSSSSSSPSSSSPPYPRGGSTQPNGNTRTSLPIHTYQIYQMMKEEHRRLTTTTPNGLNNINTTTNTNNPIQQQQQPKGRRFVSLLFGDSTVEDVRPWLRQYPVYKWPQDFEDIGWYLRTPEILHEIETVIS